MARRVARSDSTLFEDAAALQMVSYSINICYLNKWEARYHQEVILTTNFVYFVCLQ